VLSKRRLNRLVTGGYVNGWDDPRLLTLDGLQRRGYTPSAINSFVDSLGVARSSNTGASARRRLCVFRTPPGIIWEVAWFSPTMSHLHFFAAHWLQLTLSADTRAVCIPKRVLENFIRTELDATANRVFACLHPLTVKITNHPGGKLPCAPAPIPSVL
jgi:hypothetical protein